MAWKFTLLGIESGQKDCEGEEKPNFKMAKTKKATRKKSSSKKMKSQRDKFTRAVQYCHRTTKGRKTFGSCMRKRLKKKK